MKLFSIKSCVIVCFDHEIKDHIELAKQMARINPKLELLLLCVFQGKQQAEKFHDADFPENLNLIRYPCNRTFDATFALLCFFLKQNRQQILVLKRPIATQIPKRKWVIKSKGINEVSINKETSGVLLLKNKLIISQQIDINTSQSLKPYVSV